MYLYTWYDPGAVKCILPRYAYICFYRHILLPILTTPAMQPYILTLHEYLPGDPRQDAKPWSRNPSQDFASCMRHPTQDILARLLNFMSFCTILLLQWWRDLFRCRIDLLNFSMGFNITAPYMEFLHLNWYVAEWLHILIPCHTLTYTRYSPCMGTLLYIEYLPSDPDTFIWRTLEEVSAVCLLWVWLRVPWAREGTRQTSLTVEVMFTA